MQASSPSENCISWKSYNKLNCRWKVGKRQCSRKATTDVVHSLTSYPGIYNVFRLCLQHAKIAERNWNGENIS